MWRTHRIQRVSALLVAAMGLVSILSTLLAHGLFRDPALQELARAMLPMTIENASRTLALMSGFGLLLLARGIWRGKRMAWTLTLVILVFSAFLHMLKGLDWEEAVGAAVLGSALLSQQRQFVRGSDPPTLRRAPVFFAAGCAAIAVYGLAGFWLLRAFQPFSLTSALYEIAAQMIWTDGSYAGLVRGHAAWFLNSIGALSATLFGTTLLLLLRPVLPHRPRAADRQAADALLTVHATSSLAPFARDDDKQLYFGESVAGVVAYRVANHVAVVCGDPIAAPAHVGVLAREFQRFCRRQDWQVCFYEVQPRHLPDYAPLGFAAVKIGEDAWIELPKFTLNGSKISDIRHAVSKVERDGTLFRQFASDCDTAIWPQMQAIEARWRASQGGVELRFSIGRLPAQPDPRARYTVALAANGVTVLAYCAFLPIEAIGGWALDVMRRAEGCPNGTMEFLIARSLELFRDAGDVWCSLGLAPLANIDVSRNSLIERGIRAVYTNPKVNATYHYQSLFFFKRKFNPEWRGGYLLYPSALALPQVLAAVVRVHAPSVGPHLLVDAARERLLVPLTRPSTAKG